MFLWPVFSRAIRTAHIHASVPEPSIRNISTEGTRSEIFLASLYSYSWNRPVEGPQVLSSSMTGSRTAGTLLPKIVGPPAWSRS